MSSDITIYYDDTGLPIGLSGRAKGKAAFREQMAELRRLGAD